MNGLSTKVWWTIQAFFLIFMRNVLSLVGVAPIVSLQIKTVLDDSTALEVIIYHAIMTPTDRKSMILKIFTWKQNFPKKAINFFSSFFLTFEWFRCQCLCSHCEPSYESHWKKINDVAIFFFRYLLSFCLMEHIKRCFLYYTVCPRVLNQQQY